MESDQLVLLKADHAKREEEFLEIIEMLQADVEKYKKDTEKEFRIKDLIIQRKEEYIDLLKRELILAQNIIKNPSVFSHANETLGAEKIEKYVYERISPIEAIREKVAPGEASNIRKVMIIP